MYRHSQREVSLPYYPEAELRGHLEALGYDPSPQLFKEMVETFEDDILDGFSEFLTGIAEYMISSYVDTLEKEESQEIA